MLEQGAIALAIGRLADGDADEWSRIGRRRLLDGLLAGRFAGIAGAAARLEAAGLPVHGALLYGLVVSGAPVTAGSADAAARLLQRSRPRRVGAGGGRRAGGDRAAVSSG